MFGLDHLMDSLQHLLHHTAENVGQGDQAVSPEMMAGMDLSHFSPDDLAHMASHSDGVLFGSNVHYDMPDPAALTSHAVAPGMGLAGGVDPHAMAPTPHQTPTGGDGVRFGHWSGTVYTSDGTAVDVYD